MDRSFQKHALSKVVHALLQQRKTKLSIHKLNLQCHQFDRKLSPSKSSSISEKTLLTTVLHFVCFNSIMTNGDCIIQFCDTVDHKVITHGNLVNPRFKKVPRSCCSNMVSYGRSIWCDPSRFFGSLTKTEELINIRHVLYCLVSRLIRAQLGDITACVTKKDNLLSFCV